MDIASPKLVQYRVEATGNSLLFDKTSEILLKNWDEP